MGRRANKEGQFTKTPAGTWKCRIRIKKGDKVISVNATRKTQAEARTAAQEKAFRLGLVSSISKVKEIQKTTVKKSFKDFFDKEYKDKSPTTIKVRNDFYNNMIISEIGDLYIKDLDQFIINDMFQKWRNNYCDDNISKSYNFFLKYLKYLVKQGAINNFIDVLDEKPKSIKESKKNAEISDDFPLIFSTEEYIKLWNYADNSSGVNEYHSLIFLVLLLTGMRGGEIRALTVEDIDFKEHSIKINKSIGEVQGNTRFLKTTKNNQSKRTIGVNEQILSYLMYIIELRPNKESNYICQDSTGQIITKRSFLKFFDKILNNCGIEKLGRTPHTLRHTFISWAIDKNQFSPLKDKTDLFISAYVGHNNLKTTYEIYAHVNKKDLKDVEYRYTL